MIASAAATDLVAVGEIETAAAAAGQGTGTAPDVEQEI